MGQVSQEEEDDTLSSTTVKLLHGMRRKEAPAWCVPLCLGQRDHRGDSS